MDSWLHEKMQKSFDGVGVGSIQQTCLQFPETGFSFQETKSQSRKLLSCSSVMDLVVSDEIHPLD